MRSVSLALLLAALAGCDTPSPVSDFAGAPATRLEVAGSAFTVRVAGSKAQAVRTNFDARAALHTAEIVARAGLAMEQASGCRVAPGSLTGDAALIEARLVC